VLHRLKGHTFSMQHQVNGCPPLRLATNSERNGVCMQHKVISLHHPRPSTKMAKGTT
jgi:hypothetical protein